MISLVALIARGEWVVTCVTGCIWLALVYGCALILRRLRVEPGIRRVLTGCAVVELCIHVFRREDWDPTLAAAALHGTYLPIALTSWGAVVLCVCRVPAIDQLLPVRGRWLNRLLLAYAAAGLTLVGPEAYPVWRSVYSSGLMGQAYGLTDPLGCFGPTQQEVVTAWAFVLIGIPLLTACNAALLASVRAVSASQAQIATHRVLAGIAAYGHRLQRSESLW